MRMGLLEDAVTVRVWDSLVAPEEMPERLTVCAPAFSAMVKLAKAARVGGWLTGVTVTVNEREKVLLVSPPSLTVTVRVADPNPLSTGLKLIEPAAPGLV